MCMPRPISNSLCSFIIGISSFAMLITCLSEHSTKRAAWLHFKHFTYDQLSPGMTSYCKFADAFLKITTRCVRRALREHLTPPCSDFTCGGLEDHHHINKKKEFKGNKLDIAHLQLLFISCCLICNHNYLVIYV